MDVKWPLLALHDSSSAHLYNQQPDCRSRRDPIDVGPEVGYISHRYTLVTALTCLFWAAIAVLLSVVHVRHSLRLGFTNISCRYYEAHRAFLYFPPFI